MEQIRHVERILFVCLGNICRSPLAEGLFRYRLNSLRPHSEIVVDSAGTGSWHIGEAPDRRMRQTAQKNGISIDSLRARQFARSDFDDFDLILAMDRQNRSDILSLAPGLDAERKVMLFREWEPGNSANLDVPDPYFGGTAGFDNVFDIVDRTVLNLIEALKSHDE